MVTQNFVYTGNGAYVCAVELCIIVYIYGQFILDAFPLRTQLDIIV